MTVAAKTTREIRELEFNGRLLKFNPPLEVVVEEEPDCVAVMAPQLQLEAAAESADEAWSMFSDLVISVYLQYRELKPEQMHPSAQRQARGLFDIVAGFYIRQPS